MAFTIVRVASGGIPVVESERGLPYYEVGNGFGVPVTFVTQGGAPLSVALPAAPDALGYLYGFDGAPLKAADGTYVYGRA